MLTLIIYCMERHNLPEASTKNDTISEYAVECIEIKEKKLLEQGFCLKIEYKIDVVDDFTFIVTYLKRQHS